MSLLRRLFGRGAGGGTGSGSGARDWLTAASGRDGVWHDRGSLALPSRAIFVADPTNGTDEHMRHTGPVEVESLRVWAMVTRCDQPGLWTGSNALVWLEAGGLRPATRGGAIEFGVDAACLGWGLIGPTQ